MAENVSWYGPAVLCEDVWEKRHVLVSDGVALYLCGHTQLLAVLRVRDGRRARVQIQHGPNDVIHAKPLAVIDEFVVGGELASSTITIGPWFFT